MHMAIYVHRVVYIQSKQMTAVDTHAQIQKYLYIGRERGCF